MSHKEQLAIKRRNNFVDTLAKVLDLKYYQIVLLDKYIQEQLTPQEQIDLFKPTKVKLFENLFSKLMAEEVKETKDK